MKKRAGLPLHWIKSKKSLPKPDRLVYLAKKGDPVVRKAYLVGEEERTFFEHKYQKEFSKDFWNAEGWDEPIAGDFTDWMPIKEPKAPEGKATAKLRIEEILEEQEHTLKWIPFKLGLTTKVFRGYCSGRYQPSIIVLRQISKMLKVSVEDLK